MINNALQMKKKDTAQPSSIHSTGVSLSADLYAAAKERQDRGGFKSFSAYLEHLITMDLHLDPETRVSALLDEIKSAFLSPEGRAGINKEVAAGLVANLTGGAKPQKPTQLGGKRGISR